MKLFLINWGWCRPEVIDVAEELRREGHRLLYWTRLNGVTPLEESRFPGTIFHDHMKAMEGVPPAGIDPAIFPPLGREELASLAETEADVMLMMSRKFEHWSVMKRKNVYHDMLRYWHGVLSRERPDAILYAEIPHNVYDFILLALAQRKGIRTVMFENILKYDRLIAFEDFRRGNEAVEREAASGYPSRLGWEDLSGDLKRYYEELTTETPPRYMGVFKKEHGGLAVFKKIKKSVLQFAREGTLLWHAIHFLTQPLRSNMKKEYESVQSVPDYGKKYVYVPLQFQPERTSNPQGGVYANQLLLVETLAAALPPDWLIYVKEHPAQWLVRGLGYGYFDWRYEGYYRELANVPRVRLVSVSTPTLELTRRSEAVATITGIPGWEAVLRGKPALIFGYPWFQHCAGVFKVKDVESCRRALQTVESREWNFSKEKLIRYLAVLERESFPGYVEEYGHQMSSISPDQNKINILAAVRKMLNRANQGEEPGRSPTSPWQ